MVIYEGEWRAVCRPHSYCVPLFYHLSLGALGRAVEVYGHCWDGQALSFDVDVAHTSSKYKLFLFCRLANCVRMFQHYLLGVLEVLKGNLLSGEYIRKYNSVSVVTWSWIVAELCCFAACGSWVSKLIICSVSGSRTGFLYPGKASYSFRFLLRFFCTHGFCLSCWISPGPSKMCTHWTCSDLFIWPRWGDAGLDLVLCLPFVAFGVSAGLVK